MLKDFIDNNRIFKLVCGAGNECANDVERYVALYSAAGANVFDISAKPEILKAAKSGIAKSGITNNRFICVSVGIKGDPHISKAEINHKKCIKCGLCEKSCPNDAIKDSNIIKEKCIGCGNCYRICPNESVNMVDEDKDLSVVLPELVDMGIDCIELHATSEFDGDIWNKWEIINKSFDGMLSICIDRLNLGNKQVLARINQMLKYRKPYTTIIQADGIPMSGSDDTYKTTLQAVAMAEIVQNENLPVYIFISGGTNSKTAELAKMCNISYNGVAIGSFARKIVKPYLNVPDFYNKENFYPAKKLAEDLVKANL